MSMPANPLAALHGVTELRVPVSWRHRKSTEKNTDFLSVEN